MYEMIAAREKKLHCYNILLLTRRIRQMFFFSFPFISSMQFAGVVLSIQIRSSLQRLWPLSWNTAQQLRHYVTVHRSTCTPLLIMHTPPRCRWQPLKAVTSKQMCDIRKHMHSMLTSVLQQRLRSKLLGLLVTSPITWPYLLKFH